MRIDRMLSITVMLLNRDRVSARELAEKFEISIRTVYRDIEAINLAGIPVISYPGNSGGFGIMENYRLDRQLLTLNDMLGILTALKGVNSALMTPHSIRPSRRSAALFRRNTPGP
jgi:predicted DNA-binding transcriptional regulator YafY